MDDYGSLPPSGTVPTWEVDFHGTANTAVFGLLSLGPQPPALTVPSLSIGLLPLPFAPTSWPDLFHMTSPVTFDLGITDSLCRYACGIEAADDIIADIEQALGKV